ncbi:hypothetical protein FC770_08910 [Nocardioides jishulii]|uniref:Uncharacterized protein n=1 Tax=Nocardioides jishulii TaxID=2575440 RepID=A0A4U2YPA8_9ACTN|nr:DUF6544 family protein [Nocardioides jishulii]QCX27688.1 hypothetical protein FCL41_09245 [Nocardioides jishulii]TKI62495.1 hypothetical protein FC770_08910 [Nocardioides jishulii]
MWLLAAVLVLATAVLIVLGAPTWWWLIAAAAAVVSQLAVVTSWSDARAGTVLNVLLALVAAYGFLSVGPTSFHATWEKQATQALTDADATPPVLIEKDLAGLPQPLATCIRRSGAVGKPRVTSVYADFHGRIRSSPATAWMTFTGRQVNTFGERPQRLFLMDATRSGLPVTVLHLYADATATMRAKVLSLVTVVDASGAEMNRGETVTVFNELVLLAPGAIVDAPSGGRPWTPRTSVGLHPRRPDGLGRAHVQHLRRPGRLRLRGPVPRLGGWEVVRPADLVNPAVGIPRRGRAPTAHDGRGTVAGPTGWFTYIELEFDEIAYNVPSV